jgi:translocation and assembly module TamB
MRRALKISAWSVAALLLLVVALVGAVLIAGNTASGRALIERLTTRFTAGHVQLSGLSGSFPAAVDLSRLELSDDRGVWLSAERISLRWSPLALFARHVQVDSLQVARLHIERAPITKPDSGPRGTISIPHTDLTHLSVDTLELGPELAGAPTSLVLQGSAHLLSLQDATATVMAQRTGGVGDYELHLQFNAARMDATLKLREPANGPLENLLKLPGLGELSVFARVSGPRAAEQIQLTIDAGPLRARAQGSVNLVAASADLSYSLNAPAMTPSPGFAWQRVALQGRWRGTLSTPTADGHLEAEQLAIPGGTQLAALRANLTASGGMLTARAVVDGLTIPGPQPKLLQDAPLTIDASMHLNADTRPLELEATHRLFALRAHAVTAGKQSAQIDLRLPNLTPLAAIGGEVVRGDATIKAQLTRNSGTTGLTADVDAGIDGGTAIWAGVLRGGRSRLQLAAALSDQNLTIDRLLLTGPGVSLSLNGSSTLPAAEQLNARWELKLSDLTKVSPTLGGTLNLSGKINGPRNALSAAADLTATLSIRGSQSGTVFASVHADGLPSAPRGTVEAHGEVDGAPLLLNVSLERASGNTVHAVIQHADWKSAHIDGDLQGGADVAQARGTVHLHMTQLGDLDRLLDTPIQGSVAGSLALTPVGSRSHAQIQFDAHDVKAGDIAADAQLTAAGTFDALSVQVGVQSPSLGSEPASLTSKALLNLTAHELHLDSAEAKYHGQEVQLLSPATLSFADGLSIAGLKLGAQHALLDVDGRISPTLDVRASLRQLKPELINAFVPGLLANGTIQADAQVQGTVAAPLGHLHLEAIGMRSASDAARDLPAADIHAGAELMGNTALLDVKLTAGSTSQLTLSGHTPLAIDGALNLKLAGNLDVGLFNPLLEANGRHVTGELTVDTTVTGAASAPEIGGTIRLAKGSMRDYSQGVNLSDITAEIEGNHGLLRIVSMTARAAPGSVSLTGTVGVLQKGIPVDVKLTAKNAQPITNNIVTANLGADLHMTGTARGRLDIAGAIKVNRADVEIPSGLPPNVAVLDVRRPGQAPRVPSEKPLIIGLDVSVQAPRQILVKGRGLDAELGGQIRVRGTTDAPLVTGSFDLLRGTFALASSNLTFSTGSVTFNGAGLKNKIDPTLDFTAQTQMSDGTATVRITGLADAPKIELSSTPDMPQDEILARLLFGVSASQLTALQVVQIGAALATLSGGGGGLNPVAKIQKALGLDRLTVAGGSNTTTPGTANTGATIEAGRYVSSRVFVAVKESTTGTSQLAVDVDLSKHLKLQTRLGNGSTTTQGTTPENDPGSSVGLAYQFEY